MLVLGPWLGFRLAAILLVPASEDVGGDGEAFGILAMAGGIGGFILALGGIAIAELVRRRNQQPP